MRRTCATRRTAVAVTERAAAGVLCLVLRFLCVGLTSGGWVGWGWVGREKNGGDTPPVAPAVPVVERDAEGGGGGGLTDGPLDGRTNRGSNPRPRRAPAMAHTTRPSMPLTSLGAQMVFRKIRTGMLCSPTSLRVIREVCDCTQVFTRQTGHPGAPQTGVWGGGGEATRGGAYSIGFIAPWPFFAGARCPCTTLACILLVGGPLGFPCLCICPLPRRLCL